MRGWLLSQKGITFGSGEVTRFIMWFKEKAYLLFLFMDLVLLSFIGGTLNFIDLGTSLSSIGFKLTVYMILMNSS